MANSVPPAKWLNRVMQRRDDEVSVLLPKVRTEEQMGGRALSQMAAAVLLSMISFSFCCFLSLLTLSLACWVAQTFSFEGYELLIGTCRTFSLTLTVR